MMMSRSAVLLSSLRNQVIRGAYCTMSSGQKGTAGSGGAIREAGGSFGKREAALEEQYMREQQLASLKELKKSLGAKDDAKLAPKETPPKDMPKDKSESSSSKGEGALRGTQGGLSKRKNALEDQYFRNKEIPKKD
eukprot:TRINITY_DN774_c0_g1_i3.p1 TRINITY_DN774_c0_g1~~TRINITY_DN774_c0_g1_i3.p1  ORF type:complete len:136 (-),score=32.46 TRINITY_DN774_c0_g1_i3:126-533(-)